MQYTRLGRLGLQVSRPTSRSIAAAAAVRDASLHLAATPSASIPRGAGRGGGEMSWVMISIPSRFIFLIVTRSNSDRCGKGWVASNPILLPR